MIPKHNIEIKIKPIVLHFELINDTCCNSDTYLKDMNKTPFVELKNIDNLETLLSDYNKVTDHIKTNLNDIITKPHIVLYGDYYSYATIVIILIILLLVMYKIYKHCKLVKASKNVPNPVVSIEMTSPDPDSDEIPAPRLRMT